MAKKQRDTSKLPKNIMEQLDVVKFGCGTLPSDNMNMVMTHEFANDFVRKMKERKIIETELDRIASLQAKNAKHNIYVTKTQALRDQQTLGRLEAQRRETIENAYLQTNHVPKKYGNMKSPRSASQKAPRSVADGSATASNNALPPLRPNYANE